VPRKRRTRLPLAVFKALVPKPLRKRRARRAASASVGPLKAARASARSASKIARTASSASHLVKPSTRKATARSASSRTTKPRTTKPRTTARKPARFSARGKAASRAGKGTWRQARFTGVAGSRSYRVYVPLGLRRTTKVPLLLALHGCTQNGLDFAAGTRFNDLADKHKFVVVYPEQSRRHNGLRCWNWFRSAHQFRAQGEPAILAGIVRRVSQEAALWRIDAERVYVAGISAGGGMALVLAATYPELFAAVGVHSAPPYRSASGPANALAAMQGAALKGAGLDRFLSDPVDGMFKGPYVRLRLPFRPAEVGWRDTLEWYEGFPPYGHQAAAFARLSSCIAGVPRRPQPTVVTTGTGSGKTGTFLHPIVDHVLRASRLGSPAPRR